MVSVRQARGLPVVSLFPHPASFRFHLAMDTLAFGYILPTTGRIRDFHPLETCAARRTTEIQKPAAASTLRVGFCMWYNSPCRSLECDYPDPCRQRGWHAYPTCPGNYLPENIFKRHNYRIIGYMSTLFSAVVLFGGCEYGQKEEHGTEAGGNGESIWRNA